MSTPFRPTRAIPSAPNFTNRSRGAVDALAFLKSHDRLAAMLPAVTRMVALQKDCAKLLPSLFNACDVLQFESGNLVLAVPNAAVAARLKQQLPKLQEGLSKLGWQVNAIRLKVQVSKIPEKPQTPRGRDLPANAVSAFDELAHTLEDTPANQALRNALATMVARRRGG